MDHISDPDLRVNSFRKLLSYGTSFTMQERLDVSDLPVAVRADLQEMIDSDQCNGGRYMLRDEPEQTEPEASSDPDNDPFTDL